MSDKAKKLYVVDCITKYPVWGNDTHKETILARYQNGQWESENDVDCEIIKVNRYFEVKEDLFKDWQ